MPSMKYVSKITFLVLMMAAVVLPAIAQSFEFSPPEGEGFFPIGWSSDGNVFAFGWFHTTIAITNGSQLQVAIQDLVTDEDLSRYIL